MPAREAEKAVALWNELAAELSLPAVQRLTVERRRKLIQRLHDAGGLDGWRHALASVRGSKLLRGAIPGKGGAPAWCCNFDFLISPSGFTKVMEGNYRDRGQGPGGGPGSGNSVRDAFDELRNQGKF